MRIQDFAASASSGAGWAIQGIDVSSHDHTTGGINWPALAAGGLKFAYVKATEGNSYINPYFHDDYNSAKAAGVLTGAYTWARPDNRTAVGDANFFIDHAEWINDSRTLVPFLDLEWPYGSLRTRLGDCWGLSPAELVSWIHQFVDQVRLRTGRLMMIYTNTYWWNPCTNNDTSFGHLPLDLASYTTNPPTALPSGWSTYDIWQYAPGDSSVAGNYDRDAFNGDWAALTRLTGPPPPLVPLPRSTYTPAGPVRVLDTRDGTGLARTTPVGPGETVTLTVAGANGVPASGVTAVVLNVTVTQPSTRGYLTVYPDGQPRPWVSNLNFVAGQTVSNLVTVSVTNGKVDFYNPTGDVHIVADLFGYYTSGTGGSAYTPAGPARVLDTRDGTGLARTTAVGPGETLTLPVAGANGVPASGVTAVVLNVTVTQPSARGYLTVFPNGQSRPGVSNLNFVAGQTVSNLVTVAVTNGKVDFYNPGGTVHVIADLFGYYTSGTGGSVYTPAGAMRVLDTRDGTGAGRTRPVGAGETLTLPVAGVNGVPASGVTAVVLNVTVTQPTAPGFLTVFPDGQSRPGVSNLTFGVGQTVPNLVVVPVVNGKVNFYNPAGDVHVTADVSGYYTSGSTYTPADPVRMLDTRDGTGAGRTRPVGAGETLTLTVAGVSGVPASGVTAVVLNVTVTQPSTTGYLTVFPDGQSRPGVSNLTFVAGQTISNLVTVPVTNGKVDFYNPVGTVHVVADLFGYYTSGTGSVYTTAGPARVLDTRDGTGLARTTPVGPGETVTLTVAGVSGVPASGVTAVVLNVTVTQPSTRGYLTVFPDGQSRPGVSNLNYVAGQTISNLVTVPVTNGKVDFYNPGGTVHVVADLFGYYTSGTGSVYTPAGAMRVLDTRDGTGLARTTPVGPGETVTLTVAGVSGVPASGVTAVVLNVTVTQPSTRGYLTVFPNGQSRPGVSNLNYVAGQTISNLVTVPVTNGKVDFYNPGGTIHVIADLFGYYIG